MPTFHRIYNSKGVHITDVEYKNDDNQGLPDWFFDDGYINFVVDIPSDTLEWVPGCGPAPCWKAKFSTFKTDAELFDAFNKWFREMY